MSSSVDNTVPRSMADARGSNSRAHGNAPLHNDPVPPDDARVGARCCASNSNDPPSPPERPATPSPTAQQFPPSPFAEKGPGDEVQFDESTLTFPRSCFRHVRPEMPDCRESDHRQPIDAFAPLTAAQALLVWRKRFAPLLAGRHAEKGNPALPWGADPLGAQIIGVPPHRLTAELLPDAPATAA